MPGYTHLQRAQPVLPEPPPARVLLDADPRPRPVHRGGRRHRAAAARRGRAGRRQLRHRPPRGRARARLLSASPRTRSTPSPTATSCSTTWRPRRPAPRTCRASAPRSCCGRARSSASARSPTPGPRARRSCPRRRTPTPPSCCGPRRRGWPLTSSALHGVMHGLPLTYNKDMQEDKEHLFDAADTVELCLEAADGMLGDDPRSGASAWPPRRPTSSWPPPTSPTCWSGAGCRSARPTASSPGSCGPRSTRAGRCPRSTRDELRRAVAAARRGVLRGAARRRVARVQGVRGRDQPARGCASSWSEPAADARGEAGLLRPARCSRSRRDLIGCVVAHDEPRGVIVETEAYHDSEPAATRSSG